MSLKKKLTVEILKIKGVEYRKSRFSDTKAFFIGPRELAHFHEGNQIDIRVTKTTIRDLKKQFSHDERFHWRYSSSDWVEFQFLKNTDLKTALELVKLAAKSNKT